MVRTGRQTKNPSRPEGRSEGWRARLTWASGGALAEYYGQVGTHERTVADRRGAVKLVPGHVRHARRARPRRAPVGKNSRKPYGGWNRNRTDSVEPPIRPREVPASARRYGDVVRAV